MLDEFVRLTAKHQVESLSTDWRSVAKGVERVQDDLANAEG